MQAWGEVKTRIIQNEPELEPSAEVEAAAPIADERQTWLRRACFLVAVVGYIVIGVIHPAEIEVGDETTLYIAIHLVQPFFILLLAWGTWLLVKDLPGRAAQVARVAIVPYAIAYSMFDAIAGVALGGVVRLANDASAADGVVVQRLLDTGTDYVGIALFIASDLSWFVMALAAAIAVKPIGGRGPIAADGDRRRDLRHRPSVADRPDRDRALRPRNRLARGQARARPSPRSSAHPCSMNEKEVPLLTAPRKHHLAARMARWSAHHRKIAIFGWLASVTVLFVLGNFVLTQKMIVFETSGPGESGRADTILYEDFEQPGSESVLVQNPKLLASNPEFRQRCRTSSTASGAWMRSRRSSRRSTPPRAPV